MTTRTIGGFFGLELPTLEGELPPVDATLLRSGRACLRAILECERPQRLVAPYYICDAAVAPARSLGIPVVFYPIDRRMRPLLPALSSQDAVMVVDYFGLCESVASTFEAFGRRLIIDQSQALFAGGPASAWRFTSVRKWFGVPDGAFLRGPTRPAPLPATDLAAIPVHLVERRWGNPTAAHSAFVDAESRFDCEVSAISTTSLALLRGVDAELVRSARRQNFSLLHDRLGSYSSLEFELTAGAVPFCYPFLPRKPFRRERLAKNGLFVPCFWADCEERADPAFAWELLLSSELLPLPIDHRYAPADMDRLAERVLQLMKD